VAASTMHSTPASAEYRLTDRAIDLYPVIIGLMRWADRHLAEQPDTTVELLHRSCGQPTHPYLACSHCQEPLTARDVKAEIHHGA
jgi:HxlR-like helix-turn-helix